MTTRPGERVHLLCGLPGAGKTVYARGLEADLPAVRFTLDEWMLRLYSWSYDDPRYGAQRVEHRAVRGDAGSHALDAAGVRHLETILEVPDADEGIEIVRVLL